jgi:arylsulfatase A-like enzyme
MRFFLTLGLSVLLLGCSRSPEFSDYQVEDPVRHLMLVCSDTVRADTFELMGRLADDDPLAPYLDDALRFDQAYSVAPWTVPAVATLLTGVYPRSHGAGELPGEVVNLMEQVPQPLDAGIPTLAERLREEEFRAAAVVAHPWFSAGYGLERGFHSLDLRRGWNRISNRILSWIDQLKPEKQFFAYAHFMEAHHFHAGSPASVIKLIADSPADLVERIRAAAPPSACESDDEELCNRFTVYALKVLEMRRALAFLLSGLEERGLRDDTLVVFYSDHGEEFHDHIDELTSQGDDPRGEYGFGHGQSLYQELIKVPLLIWHPRRTGRDIRERVSLVDVTPSILHWLDIDAETSGLSGMPIEFLLNDDPREGLPFLATPFQPASDQDPRPIFVSNIGYGAERTGVLSGQFKAIHMPFLERTDYFDLSQDPLERQPLQSDQLVYTLEPLIGDYLELITPAEAAAPEIDDERLEQLKAIGYLQGVERKKSKPQDQPQEDKKDE